MTSPHEMVNVRYMVDDVQAAVDFYTGHLGFALRFTAAPAFADVSRGNLRLLLAGPASSAGRAAGTASTSSSTTSRQRSPGCAPKACASATRSSPAPAGSRSWPRTPPAT